MIWKRFPHVPQEGEEILVKLKTHKDSPLMKVKVSDSQRWGHIEKWCTTTEMKEFKERKLKEKV